MESNYNNHNIDSKYTSYPELIKNFDLGPPERWKYLNEGLNHVIFKQTSSDLDQRQNSPLKNMALRIRKCQNLSYYDDAALFPEIDLN